MASLRTYIETFDDGPGGWLGWTNNVKGPHRLEVRDSRAIERSPWWIDYNQAPPGGGYLHLPFSIYTADRWCDRKRYAHLTGPNRFIEGQYPLDFTNARVTLRLRGPLDLRGANLLFHIQSRHRPVFVNHCMTGRPFQLTPHWSEQTIELLPDPSLWQSLGSRHDRTDFYGHGDLAESLADVNNNILLILFPLNVVPMKHVPNPHELKAGEDYEVDRSLLPEGFIELDEVRIEFKSRH